MSMSFLLPRTSQAMAFHDATNERVPRPPSPTPYTKLPSQSSSSSCLLPSPSFSAQSQWTKRKPAPSPLSSLSSPSSSSPPPSTTRPTRQFLSPPLSPPSRKSAPTCTISLALACASSSLDPSVSPLSSVPVQVPGVVNVVPFPSGESEGVTFPGGEGVAFPTSSDGMGVKRSPSRSPPTHALLRASTSPPLSAAVPHKRVRIAASVTSPSARPSSGSNGTPKLRRKRSGPRLDSSDKEKEKEKAAVRPLSKEKEGREESPRKKARKSSFPPSSGGREKMRASTPPPLSIEDLPPPYSSMDSMDSTSSMDASSSTASSSSTLIPSSSSPDTSCSSLPSASSSSSTSAQLAAPTPTYPSPSSSPQLQSPSPQPHQPSPSKLKKAAAADLKLQASVYRSIAWGLQLRQAEAVRLVLEREQRMTPEAPAERSATTASSSSENLRVESSIVCTSGGEASRTECSASAPTHALVDEDISMSDSDGGDNEVCETDVEDDGDLHDLYDMYSSRSPIACDATSSPNGFESSSSACCSSFPQSQLLALQDRLLAARLRSYLIMQGVRWELLEVPSLPSPSYSDADVDPFLRDVAEDDKAMEEVPMDMDMDVDSQLPTSDLRSTSSPPPSPPPTYTTAGGKPPARIPTPPQAVAALWMRVASRPRGRVGVVEGRSPLRVSWVPTS
ncbi:hypothetical protein BDQ12DRAFT_688104 [Crucibulum laeve]|uniref:Uncharacterized protein n=1 Tax=Crucibulum laeve TaxID=68775 RepID=A0A5C3LRH8_9AGAR|nr:hypothetical protein BDQ12DRAFT_688104 [Crucibulum laeve]